MAGGERYIKLAFAKIYSNVFIVPFTLCYQLAIHNLDSLVIILRYASCVYACFYRLFTFQIVIFYDLESNFGCNGSTILIWFVKHPIMPQASVIGINKERKHFRIGVNYFRTLVNLFRNGDTFFREDLNKQHGVLSRKGTITLRSSLGRLSVIGRWNQARYKRGKKDGNLNNSDSVGRSV